MSWGLVAVGVGTIGGAIIGSNASKDAAKTQSDAATDAAKINAQAAQQSIQAQQEAAEQQRSDLQPFTQFGSGFIDPAQQAAQQQQELFGPNAGEAVMNSPMFQALQSQAQTNILQNQAVRGRLGTGETPMFMQDAALRTGFDVLQQERNAAMANTGQLASLVGMGQSAAAGQGAAGINTAANIGNTLTNSAMNQGGLMTDAAAANAAGIVGSANAYQGGINNMLGFGAQSGIFNKGPTVAPPSTTGINYGGGGTLQG